MRRHFNKELVTTKEGDEDFENSITYWIYNNTCVDGNTCKIILVRDHCHITGKYGGIAHREYNTNVKVKLKVPIVFHNLKKYKSHLIM